MYSVCCVFIWALSWLAIFLPPHPTHPQPLSQLCKNNLGLGSKRHALLVPFVTSLEQLLLEVNLYKCHPSVNLIWDNITSNSFTKLNL